MRLNIKKPDTKVVMYEKKSNTVSVVIAIIAIFLILGGVYLINQSFNKSKNTTAKTDTQTTSTPSTAKTDTATANTTPSANTAANNNTDTSTQKDTANADTSSDLSDPNTNTTTPNDSGASSSTTDSTTSPTGTTPASTLAADEAIIRVNKVTPGSTSSKYDIEIVETGFKDGTKLKKGAQTFINVSGVTMQQGKTYKIASITEKDGKISITSLKAVETSV